MDRERVKVRDSYRKADTEDIKHRKRHESTQRQREKKDRIRDRKMEEKGGQGKRKR